MMMMIIIMMIKSSPLNNQQQLSSLPHTHHPVMKNDKTRNTSSRWSESILQPGATYVFEHSIQPDLRQWEPRPLHAPQTNIRHTPRPAPPPWKSTAQITRLNAEGPTTPIPVNTGS